MLFSSLSKFTLKFGFYELIRTCNAETNLKSLVLESNGVLKHNPEAAGKNLLYESRWVKLYLSGNLYCMSEELRRIVVASGGKGCATVRLRQQIGTKVSFSSN